MANCAVEFARAARTHPDWKANALLRFERLVRRCIQLIKGHGRHSFIHPLERVGLVNARLWNANNSYVKHNDPDQVSLPVSMLRGEELPFEYDIDQYALIILKTSVLNESLQLMGLNAVVPLG